MNLARLMVAGIRHRPVLYGLNVLGLALGAGLVVALILGSSQLRRAATAEAQGVDLVVGASGSPLQLVLSSVYHADTPTGNIPASEWMRWRAHPLVGEALPIAMGDFVAGYRLVGTALDIEEFYGLLIAEGAWWDREMEVVVGASVARDFKVGVGEDLLATHGRTGARR
jgi:putative ABC transport system permease protein